MARPVGFDREEVLERATEVFWQRGYCATSVSELVTATRLQPGSLYAAFESKQGLFLAVLDHYAHQTLARLRRCLANADDPLQGIGAFFNGLASDRADSRRRGCLLVNSVLEVGRTDAQVQARVNEHLGDIESAVLAALQRARADGLLAKDRSPAVLAKYLMTTIWGLRVLGSTGASAHDARQVVAEALSVLHG